MSISTETMSDTPTEIVFRDTHTEGGVVIATSLRSVPKAGSPAANRNDLLAKASAALAANATFLALGASPTNAQVVAQVRLLTRENNAIVRLLLDRLEDTAGT